MGGVTEISDHCLTGGICCGTSSFELYGHKGPFGSIMIDERLFTSQLSMKILSHFKVSSGPYQSHNYDRTLSLQDFEDGIPRNKENKIVD